MLTNSLRQLEHVLTQLQGNADTDPEGISELVREVEEVLCYVLDREWQKGKEWASERLDELLAQLD